MCTCDGCTQAGELKLKFVAHVGEVAFQKVKRYTELAGVDVILVHRLLKNSVPIPEYVLMTDARSASELGSPRSKPRRRSSTKSSKASAASASSLRGHGRADRRRAGDRRSRPSVSPFARTDEHIATHDRPDSFPYLVGLKHSQVEVEP